MIAPMEKVYLFTLLGSKREFVDKIRQWGRLHLVSPSPSACRDNPSTYREQIDEYRRAVEVLNSYSPHSPAPLEPLLTNREMVDQILGWDGKMTELKRETADRKEIADLLEKLGDFSPQQVERLEDQGVYCQLYSIPHSQLAHLSSPPEWIVLHEDQSRSLVAAFSQGKPPELAGRKVKFPSVSSRENENQLKDLRKNLSLIRENMSRLAHCQPHLEREIQNLIERAEICEVAQNMAGRELINYLVGYCPREDLSELVELVREEGGGLAHCSPEDSDEPPTLLHHPRWLELTGPIYSLVNILPGYRERDVSLAFVFYLGIFFAFLVGDAGYGVLFILVTAALQFTVPSLPRPAIQLSYVFSTFTVIWGALTGNWFGVEALSRAPVLGDFVIPSINAHSMETQSANILLCFVLGATHLSVAHFIEAVQSNNYAISLSHLGWIANVWGTLLLIRHLVLNHPLPNLAFYLLGGGVLTVAVFGNLHRSILKILAGSLSHIPLRLMNCFSDLISYIRLFAVGMATLAVARSFNDIAMGFGFNSILNSLITALILALGHGVNIAMALLSVVVHGIRLNMLEFSSHLDMQWDGIKYEPFNNRRGG